MKYHYPWGMCSSWSCCGAAPRLLSGDPWPQQVAEHSQLLELSRQMMPQRYGTQLQGITQRGRREKVSWW